jgi:hypothetical protein
MRKIIIIGIYVLLLSCEKESSETNYKCTTYLNGEVWSSQNVNSCENCFAPQGYTTKCEKN